MLSAFWREAKPFDKQLNCFQQRGDTLAAFSKERDHDSFSNNQRSNL